MTYRLNGILPVLPTPFLKGGGVDLAAMPRLVRFAIDAGAGGVVFPGFASEVEQLTASERRDLLAQVVKAVDGKTAIIAGASAETVEEAVNHGSVARELGVNWLMIQPPKSIGSGAAEVIAFLSAVAAKLPSARFILQNAPAPRGSDLSPETIIEVANAVLEIAYVKEETLPAGPAITAILSAQPGQMLGVIGGGGARYILDEYARGACAAMPAIEIADKHVALDQAWRAGNKGKARDIYVRTLPLLTLQAVFRMRLTKHVMMRRGILDNTITRAPTPDLDAFSTADIDENLRELGMFDAAEVSKEHVA